MKAFLHTAPGPSSWSYVQGACRTESEMAAGSLLTERSLHGGHRKALYFASNSQKHIGSWHWKSLGVALSSEHKPLGAPLTSLDYLLK